MLIVPIRKTRMRHLKDVLRLRRPFMLVVSMHHLPCVGDFFYEVLLYLFILKIKNIVCIFKGVQPMETNLLGGHPG